MKNRLALLCLTVLGLSLMLFYPSGVLAQPLNNQELLLLQLVAKEKEKLYPASTWGTYYLSVIWTPREVIMAADGSVVKVENSVFNAHEPTGIYKNYAKIAIIPLLKDAIGPEKPMIRLQMGNHSRTLFVGIDAQSIGLLQWTGKQWKKLYIGPGADNRSWQQILAEDAHININTIPADVRSKFKLD